MGLFINKNKHPSVFQNDGNILEPNQAYYHKDNFSDMINEQKEINQTLSKAFQELKTLYHREQHANTSKWENIGDQLRALRDREREHETFERQAMEWLAKLDKNNQQLQYIMENENTMKKEVAGRVESLNTASQKIVERLAAYEAVNQDMAQQMTALAELNREMADQMTGQDQAQENVLNRLESQGALMEKVHRQISELRSILFERSSYLAEKIEDSYNLTSSYFYKLMNGSDQPLTLYMDQRKAGSEKRD
ncbi:hypothetical protein SAMN04488072_11483 [Lentibacillus halodurans]|uniref:Uncharacterized protein n=1 Tax=Lentibacillus halodurans TaxID=237679 RepID=A0A1I0ZYY9_9BACI|nr:hypothetical protein [Lentibacillus halodurans]SFB30562.1 hypothetical protein SAMN04488072_11483 [Lentibacillus halodurans]